MQRACLRAAATGRGAPTRTTARGAAAPYRLAHKAAGARVALRGLDLAATLARAASKSCVVRGHIVVRGLFVIFHVCSEGRSRLLHGFLFSGLDG